MASLVSVSSGLHVSQSHDRYTDGEASQLIGGEWAVDGTQLASILSVPGELYIHTGGLLDQLKGGVGGDTHRDKEIERKLAGEGRGGTRKE